MILCKPIEQNGEYVCPICGFGKGRGEKQPFVRRCRPQQEKIKPPEQGVIDVRANRPDVGRHGCRDAPAKLTEQGKELIDDGLKRLGIRELAGHYTKALLRWARAGFPVRSDDEVRRIYETICKPCPKHRVVDGVAQCAECGCRLSAKGLAVSNKIKMATETCPAGKWAATTDRSCSDTATALAEWRLARGKVRTPAKVEMLLRVCEECEEYGDGRVIQNLKLGTFKCPRGRW